MTQDITEFFKQSDFRMADITKKTSSFRQAVAMGRIYVGETAFLSIKNSTLKKGDVLKLAEIAGIQGAKMAWQQIPLCHPLLLDHAAIYTELEEATLSVAVYAIVSTHSKTGVEMEALAGVNAALLTIYDLTKPIEAALTISDIRLIFKKGGKKGLWIHPSGIPEKLQGYLLEEHNLPMKGRNIAILTLSDRAYNGEYKDESGLVLKTMLEDLGANIIHTEILPDESAILEQKLVELAKRTELIITTGGTGLAPRDITPETLLKIAKVEVPGIGELLRSAGAKHISTSWLSRSVAVVINDTLVIALPGSVSAVKEGIEALKIILPHALDHLKGKNHLHNNKIK